MSLVHLPCPAEKGVDITKFASRQCEVGGQWAGHPEKENVNGWSNYSDCFTKEIKLLLDKLYTSSESDVQRKIQIAKETRIIEMIGLSISLVFLLISIFIFIYFGSLRNKRTQVHKNLFFAMFAQVFVRLILYTDQWLSRESIDNAINKSSHPYSIENVPVLCEACYVVMEYTRTSVFTWMLLEGSHLHTSIVVVFPKEVKFIFFYCIGWGVPFILTTIWATVMAVHYPKTVCWWGYALSPYYWILEGPRMCIIAINFVILLNIVCIVLMKVQVNTPSEFQQIRKAVRAALLLLPLLGITNIMDVIPGPIDGTPLQFAIWFYTAHVLSSEAVRKQWRFYRFSGKSLIACCSQPEPFPVPRIRPVTEEKEVSRNEAKVSSDEPNSIL
ncbi:PDF receptor like protein [Argiope bruennichi]|uniref:PDF receptor like protein n=1 Tax=Argiope bruennichi TaxID=94029 RepID=A0A8T0EAL2_ARGBR|nr:PDF receptor like protein [Argiope bruennichi]